MWLRCDVDMLSRALICMYVDMRHVHTSCCIAWVDGRKIELFQVALRREDEIPQHYTHRTEIADQRKAEKEIEIRPHLCLDPTQVQPEVPLIAYRLR